MIYLADLWSHKAKWQFWDHPLYLSSFSIIFFWSSVYTAEWSTAVIRDQVRDHDVATPAGSLCHKAAYNRTFPCMEATYPSWRVGSLWHKRAGVATSWKYFSSIKLPTNLDNLDQWECSTLGGCDGRQWEIISLWFAPDNLRLTAW